MSPTTIETYTALVDKAIDDRQESLNTLSQEIWKNPELNFNETKAHNLLCDFLQQEGFDVSRSTPLETSFIARYKSAVAGSVGNSSLKVGVLCEYDALPGIGHACGHNLIAEAGIGTAIGEFDQFHLFYFFRVFIF